MCKYKPVCVASKSYPNCSCNHKATINKEAFSHIEDGNLRRASQTVGFGNRFDGQGNPTRDLLEV
jgi:hypothetical protein